jgi:hypothetical protein
LTSLTSGGQRTATAKAAPSVFVRRRDAVSFDAPLAALMVVMIMVVMMMVVVTVPERQRKHDVRTTVVVMMMVMIRELQIARIGRRTLLLVDCLQYRAGVRNRLQEIGIGMGL